MSETEDVSREDQIILGSMLRKAELAEELRGFQAAPANIQSQIQAEFEKNVDAVLAGTYKSNDSLILGTTPQVLLDIGFNKLPITISSEHVYSAAVSENQAADRRYSKNINYHDMGKNTIKNIYRLISNPVMVITSESNPSDSVVVLVNIVNKGDPVIAPIVIDGFGQNKSLRIDANAITSFYGRQNTISKLVSNAVKKENNGQIGIFYADKKTSPNVLAGAKVQYLRRSTSELVHKITDVGSPVKMKFSDITETQQFKRFFGDWKKILKKQARL